VKERYGEPLATGLPESPAAERNKQPIADVLAPLLSAGGTILEVASGTGQHAEHFARCFPACVWQPSEPDLELRAAAGARVARAALPNLRVPLELNVLAGEWPPLSADAVLCINMIHIAPSRATGALLAHAERLLAPGAPLILYGPFKRGGQHTAPSNAAFDASLRARNADWGVRDLDEVAALAARHGFAPAEVVSMPANNLTVVWRRE
jgi:SAM-dependent methyltransferase